MKKVNLNEILKNDTPYICDPSKYEIIGKHFCRFDVDNSEFVFYDFDTLTSATYIISSLNREVYYISNISSITDTHMDSYEVSIEEIKKAFENFEDDYNNAIPIFERYSNKLKEMNHKIIANNPYILDLTDRQLIKTTNRTWEEKDKIEYCNINDSQDFIIRLLEHYIDTNEERNFYLNQFDIDFKFYNNLCECDKKTFKKCYAIEKAFDEADANKENLDKLKSKILEINKGISVECLEKGYTIFINSEPKFMEISICDDKIYAYTDID